MLGQKRSFTVTASLLMALVASSVPIDASFGDEPLKGGLTDTRYLKPGQRKKQKKLEGGTDTEGGALQGGAQDADAQPLTGGLQVPGDPMQAGVAQPAPLGTTLQGDTSQNPPLQGKVDDDSANQELLIEWDRWRNNLQRAIQNNVIARINVHNNVNFYFDQRQQMMVSRYPLGISAWYSCDVLPDKTIINIRITQSSGVQAYDQAVYQAIADLNRNNTLRYPKGSKRQIVNQQASIGTATSNQYQKFQFGDVEHQIQQQP